MLMSQKFYRRWLRSGMGMFLHPLAQRQEAQDSGRLTSISGYDSVCADVWRHLNSEMALADSALLKLPNQIETLASR